MNLIELANNYALQANRAQEILSNRDKDWVNKNPGEIVTAEMKRNLMVAAWKDTWMEIFRLFPEKDEVQNMKNLWSEYQIWTL